MAANRRLTTLLALASTLTGCRIGFDALALTNDDGGDGDSNIGPDASLPPMRRMKLGWQHACVINVDGSLQCWGDNGNAQIGLGVGPDYLMPAVVDAGREHTRVGLGQDHSCVLDITGVIRCWGDDANGALGRTPEKCGDALVDIADGEQCDAGDTANGDTCDSLCQIGAGPPPPSPTPTALDGTRRYRELFTDRWTSCAIALDGTLWCWGRNGARQLGVGDNRDRGRPEQVKIVAPQTGADDQWKKVAVGSDHTCALRTDDSLWCWGADAYGQIPIGSSPYVRERPNLVTDGSKWLDIDSGNDYSCGIQTDHTLWCWGLNDMYQLGLGNMMNRDVPTQIPGNYIDVGVGPSSACALNDGGGAFCWGGNLFGETGGTPGTPTQIPTPLGGTWIDIEGGAGFTCLMSATQDVYCLGLGTQGRLGDGTGNSTTSPVKVLL